MSASNQPEPSSKSSTKSDTQSEKGGIKRDNKVVSTVIICIISVAAFGALVAAVVWAFSSFSSSSSSPNADALLSNSSFSRPNGGEAELIFVQILFRHGARGPNGKLSNSSFASFFPRGRGMLTDQGFKNSHAMGKFLRKRYVENGFLDATMRPKQMYWRSRGLDRCLQTAAIIGSAMFQSPEQKYVDVPVFMHDHETLLNKPGCRKEEAITRKTCPELKKKMFYKRKNSTMTYHEAIYKCLKGHPIFDKQLSFRKAESYITEFENGLPVADEIRNNIELIHSEYSRVTNFRDGVGVHYNEQLVRLRFGPLIDALVENLEKAWEGFTNQKMKQKFKVYSTQDWIMGGVLEGFGVFQHILKNGPKRDTGFNSMIVMEMWKRGDAPFVKFYFKPEEETSLDHVLTDLTSIVPGCSGPECPLSVFTKCCDKHRVTSDKRIAECKAP